MAQIPLPLVLPKHHRFETYVDAGDGALIPHLRALGSAQVPEVLWIWGPAGSGKSHVLQAACAHSVAPRVMYLPLRDAQMSGVDSLDGLDAMNILALDDIDTVSGDVEWDRALFGLYNRLQAGGGTLILAARQSPAGTDFSLPDLASRAAGSVVYQLRRLNDEQALLAVRRHAESRSLDLPDAAARYLITRVSRDMDVICGWLDDLDKAALIAKRRLTIPFIRDFLGEAPAARS